VAGLLGASGLQCRVAAVASHVDDPAALGGEHLAQRFLDVVADDLVVSNVEIVEDRLIEFAADVVAGLHVEGVHVREQVEEGFDVSPAQLEIVGRGREFVA
jgi:hypothetical protein